MTDVELASLFPPGAGVCLSRDPADLADLDPLESAGTGRFAPKRLAEFRRGRWCARRALTSIGHAAVPIPVGASREPLWPDGIVGSISHTRDAAAAVVAPSTVLRSVGIDLEECEAIEAALVRRICRPSERERLGDWGVDPLVAVRLVFSAKEACYKALWPVTRRFLGFQDIEVQRLGDGGGFEVRSHAGGCPDELCRALRGSFRISGGLLLTAALLPAGTAD